MSLLTDIDTIRRELQRHATVIEEQAKIIARQDEQLNGERGMSAALNANTAEVRGLRKAMYWVAGLIVAGSISMVFAALPLVGH
jgi:hypothetical protein